MTHDKVIEELNEVLQIDLDAIGAYQAAMAGIKETTVVSRLAEFKADHERHVDELEKLVKRFGGTPRTRPDLLGLIQKGMTRLAGLVGTEACLMAMQLNEKQTNSVYDRHCAKPFPEEVLQILERNRDDERRHAAWIESALQGRVWERDAHVSA